MRLAVILILAVVVSGCASKAGRELKSPCGPAATAYASDCGPERPVNAGNVALDKMVEG